MPRPASSIKCASKVPSFPVSPDSVFLLHSAGSADRRSDDALHVTFLPLRNVLAHTADHWRPASPDPSQKQPRPYNTAPVGAQEGAGAGAAGAGRQAAGAGSRAGAGAAASSGYASRWGAMSDLPTTVPPREGMYK